MVNCWCLCRVVSAGRASGARVASSPAGAVPGALLELHAPVVLQYTLILLLTPLCKQYCLNNLNCMIFILLYAFLSWIFMDNNTDGMISSGSLTKEYS